MQNANYLGLYQQYERFIALIAGRCLQISRDCAISFDDLMQIGFIALVRAADKYDEAQGVQFISYFGKCLKGAFYNALGFGDKKRAEQYAVSLDEPITDDPEQPQTRLDLLAEQFTDPDGFNDDYERQELIADEVQQGLDRLNNDRWRDIIECYYLGGAGSMEELAKKYGISKQRISQIHDKAMKKLEKDERLLMVYLYDAVDRISAKDEYKHMGVEGFHTTGTSAVEAAVLRHEYQREMNASLDKVNRRYA